MSITPLFIMDMAVFKTGKEILQYVLLMETYIGIAVTVLDADNNVADHSHAGTIAKELLPPLK